MTDSPGFFSLLESGNVDEALSRFDSVDDRASAVDALLEFCESLDIDDFEQLQLAIRVTDVLIGANSEADDPYVLRLLCLQRLGKFDEAFEFALSHVQRPGVLGEAYEMACSHQRTEDAEGLLPALTDLASQELGNRLYNLGCQQQARHELDMAIALYRGAIASGSPVPQAHINAGIVYLSLGKHPECAAVTREGLRHDSMEPNLWANLLDALGRAGDVDAMRSAIDDATALLGNSSRCADCGFHETIPSCNVGCGALLDDILGALIRLGRPGDAMTLQDRLADEDDTPTPRLICTYARVLSANGNVDEARYLLSHGAVEAGSFDYYRAAAHVAWDAEDYDETVSLLAAALHKNPRGIDVLRNDACFEAIADHPELGAARPIRPPKVPGAAHWDPDESEWFLGEVDEAGRKQGWFRYWRPDGTLFNECHFENGEPHGPFKRFHENTEVSQEGRFERGEIQGTRTWIACEETTTEQTHTEDMSDEIRRTEMDYEQGRVVAIRHFNGEGQLCAPDGTPYPSRPDVVPKDAFYRGEEDAWIQGEVNEDRERSGLWRTWDSEGNIREEVRYEADERHGPYRAFFADGTLAAEGEYNEDSPSGIFRFFRHNDGEVHSDFPVSGRKVARVELNHEPSVAAVAYFDNDDRECTIDGTPLAEFAERHPALADWLQKLRAIDWASLADASGSAHLVPQILLGLLAQDEDDSEDVSDQVFGDLYWHLCHQGTVYAATAVAIPFIVELIEYGPTPHKVGLLAFLKNTAGVAPHTLRRALEEDWRDLIDSHAALGPHVGAFRKLMRSSDPSMRAWATSILGCLYEQSEVLSEELLASLGFESDEAVRASILFALGRLGRPLGIQALSRHMDPESLRGVCAALSYVMAVGPEVPEGAVRVLAHALSAGDFLAPTFAELPWADDHLVSEIAQALAVTDRGHLVLDRIVEAFDRVDAHSALGLVEAALSIAASRTDDASSEDSEELQAELRQVLSGLVDSEHPWHFDVNLREILEAYGLPTSREELRKLAG